MCACGSDKRPGFRQCCGSLKIAEKKHKVAKLQQYYREDQLTNHPRFAELMLMTLDDLVPHLDDHGLNILADRISLLQRTHPNWIK
ncbi:hypothetical protein LIT25_27035 (plasmid) [Bacillus sp. F19]|nr:hypothetical protein LIT25_27035 [Bacillus sp. F19]